jgi:hypothetical protein
MNAFKLDTMTLLVLFVVMGVVITMGLGAHEDQQTTLENKVLAVKSTSPLDTTGIAARSEIYAEREQLMPVVMKLTDE